MKKLGTARMKLTHSTNFQKSSLSSLSHYAPPSKKAKESESEAETELGIFPDIPDSRLKKEFDEDTSTSFDLSEMKNEDAIFITAEAGASELETTRATQQLAPREAKLNVKSEITVKENAGQLGIMQPVIKMEVFPDRNYVLAKVEGDSEDSTQEMLMSLEVNRGNESSSRHPSRDHSDESLSCEYCSFSSRRSSISDMKRNMELHQVRYHPEHFFSDEREQVSGVMRKQFQRILIDFLFPDFIRREGASRSCVLCGRKYQNCSQWITNEIGMRKHLVLEHRSELKSRLQGILEDEGLEAKLVRCKADGIWCRCGEYLPRWERMQTQYKQFYCKRIVPDPDRDGANMESGGSEEMCEKLLKKKKDGLVRGDSTVVHSTQQALSASAINSKIDMEQGENAHRAPALAVVKQKVVLECSV